MTLPKSDLLPEFMQQLSYHTMASSAIQLAKPNAGGGGKCSLIVLWFSPQHLLDLSEKKDRDVTKAFLLAISDMGTDVVIPTLCLQC